MLPFSHRLSGLLDQNPRMQHLLRLLILTPEREEPQGVPAPHGITPEHCLAFLSPVSAHLIWLFSHV
jgi:hypothetical protein